MVNEKKESGVHLKEVEEVARKYELEICLTLFYVLGIIFTLVWSVEGWSVLAAGVGAIVGFFIPSQLEKLVHQVLSFIYKQDKVVQWVFWGVRFLVAIFIPSLVFLILGLVGGKGHAIDAHRVIRHGDKD